MKLNYNKNFYLLYNESVTYQTNLTEGIPDLIRMAVIIAVANGPFFIIAYLVAIARIIQIGPGL